MKKHLENINKEHLITFRAIDLITNEVIFAGTNYDNVIKKAEESNKKYILDFETAPEFNFIF